MIDAPARLDDRLAEEARALVADSATRSALVGALAGAVLAAATGVAGQGATVRLLAAVAPTVAAALVGYWRGRGRWTRAAAADALERRHPADNLVVTAEALTRTASHPWQAVVSAAAWSRIESLAPLSTRAAWTRAAVAVGLATAAAMLPWPARAVGTVAGSGASDRAVSVGDARLTSFSVVVSPPAVPGRRVRRAPRRNRRGGRRRRTRGGARRHDGRDDPRGARRCGSTRRRRFRRHGGRHAARAARWHVGDQRRLGGAWQRGATADRARCRRRAAARPHRRARPRSTAGPAAVGSAGSHRCARRSRAAGRTAARHDGLGQRREPHLRRPRRRGAGDPRGARRMDGQRDPAARVARSRRWRPRRLPRRGRRWPARRPARSNPMRSSSR